jgi:carbonic anhydrase/acetyltransferase-like protein (isoleucine patch superfamily)
MAAIVIGSQTNLQDGTIVHVDDDAPCRVGSRVGVGHRVILHGCTVEDDCLIGMGSVLLNKVHVGAGSVVAAGAVLPEGMQVPPRSLVMGVPARVVRPVDERLAGRIAETWSHYAGLPGGPIPPVATLAVTPPSDPQPCTFSTPRTPAKV